MCDKLHTRSTFCRLVDVLWCPSASQSLPSGTSSLSIREWRSTAAITVTCSCHSSCCPWCVTCQAISSSFNTTRQRTCTRHCAISWAVNTRFYSSFRRIAPTLIRSTIRDMWWHPAASASVAAAQHWRTEEAFVGRLARHGPERHWRCNWRVAQKASSSAYTGKGGHFEQLL